MKMAHSLQQKKESSKSTQGKEKQHQNNHNDNNDIFDAMDRLSRMIDSDKKHLSATPEGSPERISPSKKRDYSPIQNVKSFDEPDTIQNAKRAAHELSEMMLKSDELNREATFRNNKENIRNSQAMLRQDDRPDPHRTINRLYELENKKHERIAAMQYQKYKEELASLKSKPEISLNSKLLASNRSKQPIHMRTKDILNRKEERLEKLRKEVEEYRHEKDPEPTFQPYVNRRSQQERPRTAKEFTNHVFAWQTKRNEALQKEQYETITREMETLTFKPHINGKSRHLVAKKYGEVPLMQRLTKLNYEIEDRKRTNREKSAPSFKPVLNEKSSRLVNNTKIRDEHQGKFRELDSSQIVTRSFVDLSAAIQDFPTSESIFSKNSPSPARNRTKKSNNSKSPSKIFDVEYTPAMDFLLKKVNPNSIHH